MSNAINGGMLVPKPAMAQMFPSGVFVDLLAPSAEAIYPEDIAHHLGMLCRYSGGVRRFYSVAEHASLVADLLEHQGYGPRLVLAGLLHDGAEAYAGDMISPLKYAMRVKEAEKYGLAVGQLDETNGAWFMKPPPELMGIYAEISEALDHAIGQAFDIDPMWFDCEAVKTADMWALKIEAAELTFSRGENWRWPGELPEGGALPGTVFWHRGLQPELASARWLDRFERITARLNGVAG